MQLNIHFKSEKEPDVTNPSIASMYECHWILKVDKYLNKHAFVH